MTQWQLSSSCCLLSHNWLLLKFMKYWTLAKINYIPWSLFLCNHLFPSSFNILSCPNPAFTNPLTNEDARFCRAESTLDGPNVLPIKKMSTYYRHFILKAHSKNWQFHWKKNPTLTGLFQMRFIYIFRYFGFHDIQLEKKKLHVCHNPYNFVPPLITVYRFIFLLFKKKKFS